MILVDVNVPMYLVGADDSARAGARSVVEHAIEAGERLVTDAEVLQEILHRYVAIRRLDAIEPCLTALLAIVDDVFPIEVVDVQRAASMVLGGGLTARDALHLAVMNRHGISRIMSFDRGFDGLPGVTRLA